MCTAQIGLLFRMFEQLGTPTPDAWHELSGLAYYSENFPRFVPRRFEDVSRRAPMLCIRTVPCPSL